MALQVSPFEIDVNLATIPLNREWNFSPVVPRPILIIPTNKNVLVKQINVEFDMGTVAPNNDILISEWSFRFRPNYFDGTLNQGSRGIVINPVSGVFNVNASLPTFTINNYDPIMNFNEGFLMGGITIWNNCQIKLSNITTTLPTQFRIYVNILFEEEC